MEGWFILMMAGLTSVGAYVLGVKGLRLHGAHLRRGLSDTCEVVGLALVFFVVNLSVGVMIVYAARRSLGKFISLYHLSDTTLLVLSLLQALTFQAWRASARHRGDTDGQRLANDSAKDP